MRATGAENALQADARWLPCTSVRDESIALGQRLVDRDNEQEVYHVTSFACRLDELRATRRDMVARAEGMPAQPWGYDTSYPMNESQSAPIPGPGSSSVSNGSVGTSPHSAPPGPPPRPPGPPPGLPPGPPPSRPSRWDAPPAPPQLQSRSPARKPWLIPRVPPRAPLTPDVTKEVCSLSLTEGLGIAFTAHANPAWSLSRVE